MFIATLCTIAKLWKQPMCPTTDEWLKKICYLYTMEFYLTIKKNEIVSFASKLMELDQHHLKRSYPGSEGQKSYVLPNMHTLELKQM
jgi:hypothetical protein